LVIYRLKKDEIRYEVSLFIPKEENLVDNINIRQSKAAKPDNSSQSQ
jgi:hypothetical protein